MRIKEKLLLLTLSISIFTFISTNNVYAETLIIDNYKEDVDKNGIFDIVDLSSVSSKYNYKGGSSKFNKDYDINDDNIIDIYDMTIISKRLENDNFGMKNFTFNNNDNLDGYKEKFRIPYENISITNNAGNHGSSIISNAMDGNINTFWETNTQNSNNFNNEVTYTFSELTEIDMLSFAARQDIANKGFPQQYKIYGSLSETGEDFTTIFSGGTTVTGGIQEIRFQSTKFKRLKFEFVEAKENWAAIAEMDFYKPDEVYKNIDNIFVDGTFSQLAYNYNTIEKINEFETLVNNHPFKESYSTVIGVAKDILDNPNKYKNAPIITASQRGNESKEAAEHQIRRNTISLDSFGYYVAPGETFSVFVDANPNDPMPTLLLGQAGIDKNDWRRWYALKPGMNTFTAQSFDQMMPAAVYIVNRALPNEQKYAPRVRLEGGTKYPMYVHGKTTPEEFKAELMAYEPNVSTDIQDFANGKPINGKVYNISELVSENNTITTSALGALKGIKELEPTGKTVIDTMNDWEKMYDLFQSYAGFDINDPNPKHQPYPGKFNSRVFSNGPYGWSDTGYTGYNGGDITRREGGFYKDFIKPVSLGDGWAYYHEWAHSFNDSLTEHSEITNNLFSQQMCIEFGRQNDRVSWDHMYGRFSGKNVVQNFWTNLGFLTQVEYYYGKDTVAKTYRVSRENPNGLFNGISDSKERLVLAMSIATGYDLTDHFISWNYVASTEAMKAKVAHLPKPGVKLEYVNSSMYDYKGRGFNNSVKPKIEVIKLNGTNNILNLSIDSANSSDLLGYEIYRNDVLVGFTRYNTFTDEGIDPTMSYKYTIKSVDKKLNIKGENSLQSHSPILLVDNTLTIQKGDIFNPASYGKAVNYLGTDISGDVKVKLNNVNSNISGEYKVIYEVINEGISTNKEMKVKVVNEVKYLSDLDWVSATSGHLSVKKDDRVEGGTLSLFNGYNFDTYEKGFGTHAPSEIIYDISNEKYENFEAYLGVDGAILSDYATIKFEVWLDGKRVYDTGLMKKDTVKKYINISVKGAKELKLIVADAENGKTSDHAVIGYAKLTTNNAQPKLNVPSNKSVKIKSTIDLLEGVTATDAEDGNLTKQISVAGTVNTAIAGDYEVIYTVKDSKNNIVTKKMIVTVFNNIYLSDIDWKTATTGYGVVRKDKSPNNGNIKLTNASGGIVDYKKGIGAHATSTVVYDITGGGYKTFTTKIGLDRHVYTSTHASVIFQVFVDGQKVYDSGRMNGNTPEKEISIDLNGVKELKLIATDAGNGNESDHAVWADAKLNYMD